MAIVIATLMVVWAGLLFGGFVFGRPDEYRRMPLWTRIGSSAVLVVVGWVIVGVAPGRYAVLIAVGMSLGFVGDLYMADLIPWPRPHVLGGMGSFGLGHIAYIVALVGYGETFGTAFWRSWVFWLLIAAVVWYGLIYRGAPAEKRGVLHLAALPYALLLASTVGVGMGLAWEVRPLWLFALGAALFLFSDFLIALDLFNGRRFWLMGDVIWLTYGPAQALIVVTTIWLAGV